MRYLFLCLFLISGQLHAQLVNTVELKEKLNVKNADEAKQKLLQIASLKGLEKFAPEMGYSTEQFSLKLQKNFNKYYEAYEQRKMAEKFGHNFKSSLTEEEKKNFKESLLPHKDDLFANYTHSLEILRSHRFHSFDQDKADPLLWLAKVEIDLDKDKVTRLFRKIMSQEKKTFSKIIIVTEISPLGFDWKDLGLESEKAFITPINESWLKWFNENLSPNVEEATICSEDCLKFYNKWSETDSEQLILPEGFTDSIFLKVNLRVKRSSISQELNEMTFQWEGRVVTQDIYTKQILGSFTLPEEKRVLRQMDQKAVNSSLASSLYRTPMTAFMQLNKKLETQIGFNRASKLVIKGHPRLEEVILLMKVLKARGSSLGLEVFLDFFTKDEAYLTCFYRGEEKSFTDFLSSIKELKSTHSYTLVNEFTGIHYVIKFVTE